MATYNFSALADGQAISFRPGSDVLRFDQSVIAAADIRITASGSSTLVQVVSGQYAGKDVLLLNTTPYQLYTSNVSFASGTRLANGDNSLSQNDNGSHALFGTGGRDVFYGYGGDDSMNGGDGNDVFVMARGTASSLGNDSINGGNGFDIVDYSSANGAVTGSLAARSVSVANEGGTAFVTGVDGIKGGAFDDSLRGNGAANRLEGGAGNDTLDGASGRDTLVGGSGNDTYIVYAGDVLSDSGGVEVVRANVDWTLASGFENLVIVGSGEIDGTGNNSANHITGNSEGNILRGLGGNDTLVGGDEGFNESWFDPITAFDMLDGGGGNDQMFGGSGADGFILSGDYGQDTIDGGPDTDLLFAGGSTAFMVDLAAGTVTGGGYAGSARFINVEGAAGGRFADRLLGDDANNIFMGRAGNDLISGGGGNDHLMSEAGNDTLTGGSGADEFRFAAPAGTADADRITDFVSGTDTIVLDGSFTSHHEAAEGFNDESFYAAANASAAHDATDRVIYDTSSGRLYYDADGTGAAPALLMATLQGAPTLAASDFNVW